VVILSTGFEVPENVQVRSVTATGFEALLEVPPGCTGGLPAVTVTYLAAKKGVNTLPDGRVFEAGTVDTMQRQFSTLNCKGSGIQRGWDSVDFLHTFSQVPVLVAQIQTDINEEGDVGISLRSRGW